MIADLEQIEDNAALFRDGRNSAYQAVAIQLRNLLLKGRRSLLERVFPGVRLHPLNPLPVHEHIGGNTYRTTIFGHANLNMGSPGRSFLTLPVNRDAPPIPLDEWLDQWVVNPETKIRKLIQETANEEVAHTEDERGPTLANLAEMALYRGRHPSEIKDLNLKPERHMHQMMIVAIGEYVASLCRELLLDVDAAQD